MASAGVQKEQSAQLEGVKQAHGLEDGEHVKEGEESDLLDTKLDVNGNVELGKEEEGLVAATATPAVVTDIEKKRKRAERFGTDLKISEAEKRKLRAARFNDGTKNGTTEAEVKTQTNKVPDSSLAKSPSAAAKSALIEAENAKRKARAERFGSIPEEVKVAGESKVAAKPKLSQDEEAKKKARMARFTMAAK